VRFLVSRSFPIFNVSALRVSSILEVRRNKGQSCLHSLKFCKASREDWTTLEKQEVSNIDTERRSVVSSF